LHFLDTSEVLPARLVATAAENTVLELGSVHVTNVGIGLRFTSSRWDQLMPNTYAFVEGSRVKSTDPLLEQWRIFAGALIQY
jgi:hypothetical protein